MGSQSSMSINQKQNTVTDFWRLVVSQHTRLIVMIAKCYENLRPKCAKYWPDKGKEEHHKHLGVNILTVKNIEEENKGPYIKRTLLLTVKHVDQLSHSQQKYLQRGSKTGNVAQWKIYQYQYLGWPDHGCPESAQHIVKFLTDIHSEHEQLHLPTSRQQEDYPLGSKGQNGSLLVHCSAGVGRTGTI